MSGKQLLLFTHTYKLILRSTCVRSNWTCKPAHTCTDVTITHGSLVWKPVKHNEDFCPVFLRLSFFISFTHLNLSPSVHLTLFHPPFKHPRALPSLHLLFSAQHCSLCSMHALLCQLKINISQAPDGNVQCVRGRAWSWYIHLMCVQSGKSLNTLKTVCFASRPLVWVCVCPLTEQGEVLMLRQAMWRPTLQCTLDKEFQSIRGSRQHNLIRAQQTGLRVTTLNKSLFLIILTILCSDFIIVRKGMLLLTWSHWEGWFIVVKARAEMARSRRYTHLTNRKLVPPRLYSIK